MMVARGSLSARTRHSLGTTTTRASKPRVVSARSTATGFRKTREAHASELAEDYVELIDDLIAEFGEARLVDIAARIGVSHVTANKTVARLQRDGLVQKRPYRAIFLTPAGQELARTVRRRHQIVLDFLCAVGVPRGQAGVDAEGIEHHISEVTLAAMAKFLKSAK